MSRHSEIHHQVGGALLRMIRRAEEAQEKAARQQGLHPTDFRCIGYLVAQDGPVSPREIIAYLGLTSGAGTALLDRLEAAGFTKRVRNPDDRRSVLIVLDAQAAAGPVQLHQMISEKYFAAMADLSDESMQAIALYLERVEALSVELNTALYDQPVPLKSAS